MSIHMTAKKKLFGKGVYGKSDVPIRLFNAFIALAIVLIVALTIIFAQGSGYTITFDTGGGSEIAPVNHKNGEWLTMPDTPVKPGYQFVHWVTSEDESLARIWDFARDTVEDDQVLYAVWEAGAITVKFDLNGGSWAAKQGIGELQVLFGGTYGTLPQPAREGYAFAGWLYSGETVTAETVVTMTGEHVLTAQWNAE